MEARRKWLTVAGMLAAGFAGGFVAQWVSGGSVAWAQEQPAAPDVVRARALLLVDTEGTTRGAFGVLPGGGVGLALMDETGQARVGLGVDPQGNGGVNVNDAMGEQRLMLGVTAGGQVGLIVRDEAGGDRFRGGFTPDGPGLTLHDENGTMRFAVWVEPEGEAVGLTLADERAQERVAMSVEAAGGDVVATGADGKVLWSALGATAGH
jgi:hypothetical protein